MIKHLGEVKRTDLHLRTKYLGLKTSIYRIDGEQYLIYCRNYKGNFVELKKHFNHSIRPVCCPVELVGSKPLKYSSEVDAIPFDNIVSNFQGICLTMPEIQNILTSKFHYIDFVGIVAVPGLHARLEITVSNDTPQKYIAGMEDFLAKMQLSFARVLVRKESKTLGALTGQYEGPRIVGDSFSSDPIYCFTDKRFPFSIKDADFWFSNVEMIYRGRLDRSKLPFYNLGETKCYLDFTSFNNINLRNTVLLYDKIYMALPIENNLDKFLEQQNITENELIELVARDKLVFLLPNTESRYNRRLVIEAYNQNNHSVISKRGINTLLACYINEVEKSYFASYPEIRNLIFDVYHYFRGSKERNVIQAARIMAWPFMAKLQSFPVLNQHSPMAMCNFGVNTVLEDMIRSIERTNELSFEFTVNSSNIHIATALQATYFPFKEEREGSWYSDKGVSTVLANLLNSYCYTCPEEIEQIEKASKVNDRENNYINLLNCDSTISIIKFAELAQKYDTTKKLMAILSDLECMGEDERREKISTYNTLICDIAQIPDREKWKCLKYFLGAASLIPLLPPPVPAIVALMNLGVSVGEKALSLKDKEQMKQLEYKIGKVTRERAGKDLVADVYVLDKIARVAKLQYGSRR